MSRIGVLALQGGFSAHLDALWDCGVQAVEVRRAFELGRLDGLVLPGGESTSLLHLMRDEPWFEELRELHDRGGALFATCAGVILLAREVRGPHQPSVGLLDVVVDRNAYGRQVDSFEAELALRDESRPLRAVFIRAPRLRELGPDVETLARFETHPVLLRQGRILAASFHPELGEDRRLHRMFLNMAIEESEDVLPRHVGSVTRDLHVS